MITTPETETQEAEDAAAFRELLLKSAVHPRDRAAVRALLDEEQIFAHEAVRKTLLWETTQGVEFAWERVTSCLYTMGLDDSERAFFSLVMSLACPHQTSLTKVMDLDERRTAILLRAMIELSGCDTLAVGTRT
ncbi:hypothetical protein ACFVGN_34335 [Streptomyces sp. NPDC057757]|uniref:hypothetical protein n=1 Tax=Streptomyces sp. NPDC057757 TaxID=3346241 RepID=UPI00367AAB8D